MSFNIVLFEPEIPFNTAAIGRSCVLTGSNLHLIKPLGFSLSDKAVKRAGMDYWKLVKLYLYDDFDDFITKNGAERLYFASTKAKKLYTEIEFQDGDFLVFGRESSGLPDDIRDKYEKTLLRIPMNDEMERSLNLSNSVAIILYEALRQTGFLGLY